MTDPHNLCTVCTTLWFRVLEDSKNKTLTSYPDFTQVPRVESFTFSGPEPSQKGSSTTDKTGRHENNPEDATLEVDSTSITRTARSVLDTRGKTEKWETDTNMAQDSRRRVKTTWSAMPKRSRKDRKGPVGMEIPCCRHLPASVGATRMSE